MRRVVVTGLGMVSPLGVGVQNNWERLIKGESGIRAITSFDVSDLPAKVAGQVPRGPTAEGLFTAYIFIAIPFTPTLNQSLIPTIVIASAVKMLLGIPSSSSVSCAVPRSEYDQRGQS